MPGSPDLVSICDKLGGRTFKICFVLFFSNCIFLLLVGKPMHATLFAISLHASNRLQLPIKQLCVSCRQKKRGKNVLSKSFVCMLFTWPTFWLTCKHLCCVCCNGEGYDLWNQVTDRCQQAISTQGICCQRHAHMLSHMGAGRELCNSE